MIQISRKNLALQIVFFTITIWCAFEFIISPYPFYGKVNGVFPTLLLGGLSFDISEILIFGFIFVSYLFLFYKVLQTRKISLGYSIIKYLVLIFSVTFVASIVFGLLVRGSDFLTMIRVESILLLFVIFMNLYNINYLISKIVKIVYFTGLINALIAFLAFLNVGLWKITIYPDFMTYMTYMWFGLYISVFSYAILLNKIIKKNASLLDYFLIVLIIIVVLINISNKPIVLSVLIVTFSTFLVFFKSNINRIRIIIIFLLIFLSPWFVYMNMSAQQKKLFIFVVSQRFLKQEAYSVGELIDNLSTLETSGGSDISAGRFELWQWYLTNSLNSPVISDKFGTRPKILLSAIGHEVGFPTHNVVVHYTYYAGYLAGISLLLLILYFIRSTFIYKKRLIYISIAKRYDIKPFEFHAILAFIYAIIANELIGGPLTNAKFSWFFWLLVVFILKVINEARMEKNV